MRKERAHIGFSVRTPLEGFGVVLLAIGGFLVFLWLFIILARIIVS